MDDKKIIKKQKITIIILSIIAFVYFIICMSGFIYQIVNSNKITKISYNGIEYENTFAYVNLLVENNSDNQVIFNRENFSIKNTNIAKTSLTLYYEKNVSYNQLTGTYILNNGEKVKIKLQFNKSDIANETILYFNGEKIANL